MKDLALSVASYSANVAGTYAMIGAGWLVLSTLSARRWWLERGSVRIDH